MKRLTLILLSFPFLLCNGCGNQSVERNCGCDGKATSVITDSPHQTSFLVKRIEKSYMPDHVYVIVSDSTQLYICNEEILSDLGEINTHTRVSFSGELKPHCVDTICSTYIPTCGYIVLNNIENNCGCESDPLPNWTVDELTGSIYKNVFPGFLDYNFVIRNGRGDYFFYFICNDDILSDFGEIPEYPGVSVRFSGEAKDMCDSPSSSPPDTFFNLSLTSIELN